MNPSRLPNPGFTLTELLVVITVVGILTTIAIPSFTSLSQSQRVKNASFDLYSLFTIARSEAIKRNAQVTVAPVMVGSAVDRFDVTSAGGALLYSKSMPKKVAINTDSLGITYQRNGRPTAAGAGETFQIDIEGTTTSTPSTHVRCITIGLSGVPSIKKGAC